MTAPATADLDAPQTVALAESRGLLRRVWREYVVKHLKWLAVAIVLMTLEGGMLGLLSYMVRPMFDTVFVAGDTSAIGLVAGAVFALFLVRAASGFGQRYLVVTIGLKVVTQMQRDLTAHLLRLDPIFFQANAPGGLIERVRGDAQALQQAASTALMTLGRDTVSLVSLLAVAFWVDWVWALLVFVGVPLVVGPVWILQRLIRRTARGARGASATLSTRLDEIFHGMTAIKVNGLEEHEKSRFARAIAGYLRAETHSQAGRAALPALVDVLAALGFMGVLLYGGQQIASGEKSVGEFMSFFTAMALLFDPLRRLSNVSGQIQAALASLERLYGLFDTKARVQNRDGADTAPPAGDIVFDNVRFAYGDQAVLNGLSFTAKAGQTTALVGASGAGKSTVFNMLTRLIEPQSGQIRIGGADIGGVDLAVLRRQFSLVSQDAALFDETLSHNIALGRLEATDADIARAADLAEVSRFANALPKGLQSPAGPRGSNLSGGQRQRVAIARAVLRDAPILLLDEPTSALDAKSETAVQTALTRLAEGRTTLVIAHRLSTIQDADQILVLDQGVLVDQGTHDALLARGGPYAQLYALQFRAEKPG